MEIDLVKFGIVHFRSEIENISPSDIDGLTMGSVKKLKELIEILDWCEEKKLSYMFGWRMVKINNDVGSYYYRLCPSLAVLNDADAMLIRLSWPDVDIQINKDEEE